MARGCECPRVPVLCGCGWGRLALPACDVPELCPMCGFDLWSLGGVPDTCCMPEAMNGGAL